MKRRSGQTRQNEPIRVMAVIRVIHLLFFFFVLFQCEQIKDRESTRTKKKKRLQDINHDFPSLTQSVTKIPFQVFHFERGEKSECEGSTFWWKLNYHLTTLTLSLTTKAREKKRDKKIYQCIFYLKIFCGIFYSFWN